MCGEEGGLEIYEFSMAKAFRGKFEVTSHQFSTVNLTHFN